MENRIRELTNIIRGRSECELDIGTLRTLDMIDDESDTFVKDTNTKYADRLNESRRYAFTKEQEIIKLENICKSAIETMYQVRQYKLSFIELELCIEKYEKLLNETNIYCRWINKKFIGCEDFDGNVKIVQDYHGKWKTICKLCHTDIRINK